MHHELEENTRSYGVRLTAHQITQFELYLSLLQSWSKRVNLVGSALSDVVLQRHFLESIALGAALREREIMRPGTNVLDVGSGAGFPGTVLKIVWPSVRMTLLEATAKKTAFLSALVDGLELFDVTVLTGRAESIAQGPDLRASFDLVLARAVAPLPTLLELTLPFARVGGRVVTPKGSRAEDEVVRAASALRILGGRAFVVPFAVSGPTQKLIIALKQRDTPSDYPRRPGVPRKTPL